MTETFRVGLVQINNSFSGQNYLPYSIGCLQSYAQAHAANPGHYEFLLPVYKRMPVNDGVEHLKTANIVGFSTYVWNARISLAVAEKLKALNPETLVIFGGPQVPDNPEEFLRQHSFIDVVVHNEGEQVFLNLLEAYPSNDWPNINGISYIGRDDEFVKNQNSERMRDLNQLPSPFTSGIFAPLMEANPDEKWIGLWETNRGCPFKCTFCDWGSATAAKLNKFNLKRLLTEVDWFAEHSLEFIFCCDANFGILPRDIDLANYVAKTKKKTGYPTALSVQNTKNATERAHETVRIMSEAGLNKGVALSMQSLNPETLYNIKRENISLDTYFELQNRLSAQNVETFSDLILGLPGETYESFSNGVNTLIDSGQHNRIQFNNLSILPNAEMGDPEYQHRFGMVTVESDIINVHGVLETDIDDVVEIQDLVIATDAMPPADWRRTRIFSWMTSFLYFDKILQLPMMLVRDKTDIPYNLLIEAFLDADTNEFPLIGEINDFFLATAESIQSGGPEYVYSPEWLGIYWPADEYIFIKLVQEGKFPVFFDEAEKLLIDTVSKTNSVLPEGALADAIRLNRAMVNQPYQEADLTISVDYNIVEFCNDLKAGHNYKLDRNPVTIIVNRSQKPYSDFSDWCREIVWWGNKKGAYLYGSEIRPGGEQLAGHH